jgi:lysophospholipase L1-like esterase
MGDELPDGTPRGWADQLAACIGAGSPELSYANLALRGRLTTHVRGDQLTPALALRPDLVGAVVGMNDLLRPSLDLGRFAADVDEVFGRSSSVGAVVLAATLPDPGRLFAFARPLRARAQAMNAVVRERAAAYGVVVLDCEVLDWTYDLAGWAPDRLHPSARGHARMAASFAERLGIPVLPAVAARCGGETVPDVVGQREWLGRYAAPWVWRRLTGRSSGDGREAKRPSLAPWTSPTWS